MFCTEKERKTCNVEKMGCEGCFYNLEGPMEEYLKCYDELKRNKHIFKTIEPDFFFKFTEYLINKNKQLEFLYSDCCKCLLNSIPKSKVIEKIRELKPRIEQYEECSKRRIETDVEFYENIADTAIVQVLQELLEE